MPKNTCVMCHSLYVKANGELPCWDDVGEKLILGVLDAGELQSDNSRNIFHSPELQRIRQSFLSGKDPQPDLCKRCAVRGYGGGHHSLRPTTMEILHLEASYLCHLSCPQCIPAADRHKLKAAPYHLSPVLLEALLRQLRKEGVEHIKVVHFEGRGDPLMNPEMPKLMEITKAAYPRAFTIVTTHGSYPYKGWVVDSGLDLLRVSIDGAFLQSYEKYRVGGNLETVFALLRKVRDEKHRLGKHLQVDWKYILFEWNDGDEEIVHAARMAEELDVRLRFVLTHSPGRSQRFPDVSTLQTALTILAPQCLIETTFQLKEEREAGFTVDSVVKEEVRSLYWACASAIQRHDTDAAIHAMIKALEYDPGIHDTERFSNCKQLLDSVIDSVLSKARFPETLSGLARISHELGDLPLSERLFRRHLQLAAQDALRRHDFPAAMKWSFEWLHVSVGLRTWLRMLLRSLKSMVSQR